ncbi:MAG: DUF1501 domain-containing protein [Planctomycetes bacterium]|nr:DUF1501 domain-containing protein [Planctomycetota bacterium]
MSGFSRREALKIGALSLGGWLSGASWARAASAPARSVIWVWLEGGPSQLETFDPHPGTKIGGPTQAIDTRLRGVQIGADYPRLAERLDRVSLIRSMVSKEGEHQRGRYLLHTGYPVSATIEHPSLGAVLAHELERPEVEIPKHVCLLTPDPPRGGYLGGAYNAFAVGDPAQPVRGLTPNVELERLDARLTKLELLERRFRAGRAERVDATQHETLATRARVMLSSTQSEAFQIDQEPAAVREAYGGTPFGNACLAARRLVEVGVPAIEVSLGNWDSHVDNFDLHRGLAAKLDAGLSALLDDLEQRDLLQSTLVLCGGEFGRTPTVNPLGGRDHWTQGFSYLVAGGGLARGRVIGSTDPQGAGKPTDPVAPRDLLATVYKQLGVDGSREFYTPEGRPVLLNEGTPLPALLA